MARHMYTKCTYIAEKYMRFVWLMGRLDVTTNCGDKWPNTLMGQIA